MFIFNWLSDTLGWLGLLHKNTRVVFLGLDNAGKTTLLQKLKDNRVSANIPTLHPHTEDVILGKTKFNIVDLGGHYTARKVWKDYYEDLGAIIFLVDASDPTRFAEARDELKGLFEDDSIADTPIAILGNKIDAPTAVSEEVLRQHLGLHENTGYGNNGQAKTRPVKLVMCSVINQAGYDVAFKWINDRIK
eukprot:GDKJ01059807.1.p1 GENE.GDKJ01059807.1~~GDKJ01059807.1.p1  ORF type:complete len:191 (-),score=44.83 GDKJ01059807.1:166-738(-)